MQSSVYLENLLGILAGSFDIYRPVTIIAKEYPAYGYFFSLSEKFLVTQKVNLWSARMYEHIVFMQVDRCTEATLAEARDLIENHMEYMYVRKGEKYPEKDAAKLMLGGENDIRLTLAYRPEVHEFRFERSIQLKIAHFQ